jgi:hypothetical protein
MIKYENLDNFRERMHTLEITLQNGEYKGTLVQKIGGNCFGLDILNSFNIENLYPEELTENNCSLEFIGEDEEGNEWFKCILKDKNGEELEIEDPVNLFNNLVVKLEIIDCKIEENS